MWKPSILIGAFVALFAISTALPSKTARIVGTFVSIMFPLLSRFLTSAEHFEQVNKINLVRRTKALAVFLVTVMTLLELLVKQDDHLKHILEIIACILVSNATLLIVPSPLHSVDANETSTKTAALTTVSETVVVAPVAAPSHVAIVAEREKLANEAQTGHQLNEYASRRKVAENGNGKNKPLSEEQMQLCVQLQKMMFDEFMPSYRRNGCENAFLNYCDLEACRRFLVARGWSLAKAKTQLSATMEWRLETKLHEVSYATSSMKSNPYGISMRVIGMDPEKRPVIFTTFLHATDRYHLDKSVEAFQVILEESGRMISRLFRAGETKFADQLQWVLVVDFAGFGVRDANPIITYYCGKLLTYFPEMLNHAVLIDAPGLFSTTYNMLLPILDDRVREKIAFCPLKAVKDKLAHRLGIEMSEWLVQECESSRKHRTSLKGKREYWTIQENGHDARGVASYTSSNFYVETAGDVFAKMNGHLKTI